MVIKERGQVSSSVSHVPSTLKSNSADLKTEDKKEVVVDSYSKSAVSSHRSLNKVKQAVSAHPVILELNLKEVKPNEPVKVELTKQSVAKQGNWEGINKPKLGYINGQKVVFKHNTLGIFQLNPEDARETDIKEIVAAHILKEFGLPVVVPREAYIEVDGKRIYGMATPFTEVLRTLEDTSVEEIKNPDQAVQQNIVTGWMGDWDRIFNDSNIWILEDGTTVAADFGFTFSEGITDFGLPNANLRVMNRYARPDNVEPIVDKIRNLKDKDIKDMIHRIGTKYIKDWNPKLEKKLSQILIHNRDLLKKNNPFDNYYNGFHPEVKSLSKFFFPLVFFTPDFRYPNILAYPEIILDTLAALSGVYGLKVLPKIFRHMELAIIRFKKKLNLDYRTPLPEGKS